MSRLADEIVWTDDLGGAFFGPLILLDSVGAKCDSMLCKNDE